LKIFVSYSRADAGNFAEKIHIEFGNGGHHQVFTDVNSIRAGETWSNAIESNISKCDLFVVLVTPASLKSEHVEKEVSQAQQANKLLIPCFHKFVNKNNRLKWGLDRIQGIDFEDKYDLILNLSSKIEESLPEGGSSTKIQDGAPKMPKSTPSSKSKEWYLKRAEDFKEIGLYKKAEEMYDAITKLDSDDSTAWLNKGQCFKKMGKYEDAIKAYDEAISIYPKYAEAWYVKGLGLKMLGKKKEAKYSFDEAKKLAGKK
jgi:tetratricopeptide (TPR) repeat protein